jgi:hypothetical protein
VDARECVLRAAGHVNSSAHLRTLPTSIDSLIRACRAGESGLAQLEKETAA